MRVRFSILARKNTPGFRAHMAVYKRAVADFGYNSYISNYRGRIDAREWKDVGYTRANDGRGTIIWYSRTPEGAMWLMAWKPEEATWS